MAWKQLNRRMMLQGTGTLLGLPLLEAMFPFKQVMAQTMGAPVRLMVVNWQFGAYQDSLNPTGSGTNFNFASQQSALNPFKSQLTPIRRVFNYWGNVDGAGDHARGQGTYLTCMHINKSETDIRNGISMDQHVANAIGNKTSVPSAFFSGEDGYGGDSGYGSVYMNLSWRNGTTPTTRLGRPHQIFDTLLGGLQPGQDNSATLARLKKRKSVLDAAVADAGRLIASLGSNDRQRMDQYLTSVREVETRISSDITSGGNAGNVCNPGTRPATNLSFAARTKTNFDLMVLASLCDSTRVFVYHMGTPYDFGPINGVAGDHHNDYSHHQDNQNAIDGLLKIAQWYCDQFGAFLNKMSTTMDVNGKSLLYNSIVTYGAEMRDTNAHDDYNIPLLVAGNAGGAYTPGKVIDTGQNIPMANVWLTIMKTMGVNINSFGEGQGQSTGTVAL
ncbi:MAG: DUF1552 domain-containing protein [Bdellovibrionales bacterium]